MGKTFGDITLELNRELKKLLLESANPLSPDQESRRIIEKVVPLLIGTFLTENAQKENVPARTVEFPSREKHFSRNRDMPYSSLPKAPEEAEKLNWDDGVAADCHQFTCPDKTNRKYVSPDGHEEVIFDKDGDVVTAPEDCGSYNFVDSNVDPAGHFYMDVLPWIAWGNDEKDSTNISMRLRSFVIEGGGNAIKKYVIPRGSLREGMDAKGMRSVPKSDQEEKKALAERLYSEKLYRAIDRNNPDEVRKLLKEKGDVNQVRTSNPILQMVDFENIYPLEKACRTSYQMACMLLDAGADAGVVDPYIGSTPLIYALSDHYEERFDLAFRLIERGAVIDAVDDNGRCALNRAVVLYDTDSDAAGKRQLELVKYLFEACNVNKVLEKCRGNPLVEAARFNNLPVMEYILDSGKIDINRMADGYTALMKAVLANCREACEMLLERGADCSLISPTGKTAGDYAEKKGNPEIMRLFSEYARY